MPREQTFLSLISGQQRGLAAALARAGLAIIEPGYSSAARVRNKLFDSGVKSQHGLGRRAISVGNLTTGGTGKTPIVQWLAATLIASGHSPAVLLRGYRSAGGVSDEAELYRQIKGLEVEPDPDRIAAAARVLRRAPATSVFLLDDGFQHRRAKRDLDIVLIDATNPFGHGHVLPRGLLREPASGLARADLIIVTRADLADDGLTARLRALNPTAPILRCRLAIKQFINRSGDALHIDAIHGAGAAIAVAGIGNPHAFFAQVDSLGVQLAERLAMPDHEAYGPAAIERITLLLGQSRTLVTTEKDWIKLATRSGTERWPIARAELTVDFADGDREKLLCHVAAACGAN